MGKGSVEMAVDVVLAFSQKDKQKHNQCTVLEGLLGFLCFTYPNQVESLEHVLLWTIVSFHLLVTRAENQSLFIHNIFIITLMLMLCSQPKAYGYRH